MHPQTLLPSFLGVCLFVVAIQGRGLNKEFTWTHISYAESQDNDICTGLGKGMSEGEDIAFPGESVAARYSGSKPGSTVAGNSLGPSEEKYSPQDQFPMGADRYGNKLFITVPRRRPGVTATLNYVSLDCKNRHNVPLTPYPNYEINQLNTRRPKDPTDVLTPFVSIYRTTIDQCHRMWFVDLGQLEYPEGRQQVQPGAIVVIDLKTDKVIRRYPLKDTDYDIRSTFPDITIDVTTENCDDAYAYLPDIYLYRLVVYSWKHQDSWVVNNNYFHMMPRGGDLTMAGYNFQWDDGVFSVALTKPQKDGYRTAFFHAMASTEEFSVSTRILRNQTLATRSYHGKDFTFVGDRGSDGQSSTHCMHQPSGVLFFAEVQRNGMGCWNVNKPLGTYDYVHRDPPNMIYPGDVTVDLEDNVWMMTNSLPIFLYGQLDTTQVNFRVWSNSVKEAVKGTKCDPGL